MYSNHLRRRSALYCLLLVVIYGAYRSSFLALDKADVPYLDTPPEIVEMMLDLAGVDEHTYLLDLGSGDGRIPIAAGLRGGAARGVEIDESLVAKSRALAREKAVHERVDFVNASFFEVDLSRGTVVTLFLSPRINRELQPKLLKELRPGAKVVTHMFEMEGWVPHRVVESGGRRLFLYVVPEPGST